MTGHFIQISFPIEFGSKINVAGNVYVPLSKKIINVCIFSFNSHALCSVEYLSDTT